MTSESSPFPHPVYARYVLEPGFRQSQQLLWPHMAAANEAHVLMLAATGIISGEDAAKILVAHDQIEAAGPYAFTYQPEVEDLFFLVETKLIELAGAEAGGNLQIARSRNDLAAAMCRLMVRQKLLTLESLVLRLRATLIELAEQHVHSLMTGITHTQPAQPTTLAHYLLAVLGPLERDSQRLRQARTTTNRSPLGVAAFTTTSFPIDRELSAQLLGFDGIIANGYDAVGVADHLLESTQALVTMSASLSRFVGDLAIWSRAENGLFHVSDAFIQISSIMPQKRNPVVLEHIRTRIGYVYGDANTVATMIHNAAFGDTNDVEDPIYAPVSRAFGAAEAVLELLTAVLKTARFDTDRMSQQANQGFTTTTAVADGLVRDFALPFRTAHHIVATAVQNNQLTSGGITAIAVTESGLTLDIGEQWLADQLDPWKFVEARTIPGGPAPATVEAEIESARLRWQMDTHQVAAANAVIATAAADRRKRIEMLVSPDPSF